MAWIFFNDAFLSIVKASPTRDGDDLLVRARVRGDIERVFPTARVLETPERDYRFRFFTSREQVADAIRDRILSTDYLNFKSSVPLDENDRHDAYFRVWCDMNRLQTLQNLRAQEDMIWRGWEQQDLEPFLPPEENVSPVDRRRNNRKTKARRPR